MSNYRQNPKINISFYDIPFYIHTMAIGRNTALMCNEPLVKEELIKCYDFLKEQNNPLEDIFDEFVLAKLGLEIKENPEKEILVAFEPPRWQQKWYSKGYIVVTINNKKFHTDKCDWEKDSPKIEEIKNILSKTHDDTIMEFDFFTTPAIAESLSVANATAIMCDARILSPNIKETIENIQNQTPIWFQFFKEEDIRKLGNMIKNHSSEDFKVEISDIDQKPWNPDYRIQIFCKDQIITSTNYKKYNTDFNDQTVSEVKDFIMEMTPLKS